MCMLADSLYTEQKSDGGFSLIGKCKTKQFNTAMKNIQSCRGRGVNPVHWIFKVLMQWRFFFYSI